MPYYITDPTSGLIRTTGLPTGDYTCMIRYKFTDAPGVSQYRTVMVQLIDAVLAGNVPTTYGGNTGIYSNSNSNLHSLDVFFGTDSGTSTTNLSINNQYVLAYIRKTFNGVTTHYFFSWLPGNNNVVMALIGSVNKDITGANINALVLGNDGSGAHTNLEVAYFRDWSAALENNELYNEACSSRAIRTTNLVSDCPFEADLLDKSGNGNSFLNQGVAGSFTTSVPTPNFTVGALPYSQLVTQATFNVSNLVWFKYTNSIAQTITTYTNSGGTFIPKTSLFLADGVSLVYFSSLSDSIFRILSPGDYYFKVVRTAGGASNFDFTTQFASLALNPSVPSGSIIINDDSIGFSAMAAKLDGTLLGLLTAIPSSEMGAISSTGVQLWYDRFTYNPGARLKLLNSSFSTIAATNTTPALSSAENLCCICITSTGSNFYILDNNTGKVWKMTSLGLLTDTGVILPIPSRISAIGVNLAETKIYYNNTLNSNINQWDLISNVSLGIFYTIPNPNSLETCVTAINNNNGEILTLQDDSIVFYYIDFTATKNYLMHVNATGTLIDSVVYNNQQIDHINYFSDSLHINIWLYPASDAEGQFGTLMLSTGAISPSFTNELYVEYLNINENPSTNFFGPSSSCTMLTYIFKRFSGIYQIASNTAITPRKTRETYWLDTVAKTTTDVKIPDPLFRTALIGD